MLNRQLTGVSRQQESVARAIAMLDDNSEALVPLVAQLDTLAKQRQALSANAPRSRHVGMDGWPHKINSLARWITANESHRHWVR
jgi:hypothetical protein